METGRVTVGVLRSVEIPTFPGGIDECIAHLRDGRNLTVYPRVEEFLRSVAALGGIPQGQEPINALMVQELFPGSSSRRVPYSQVLEEGRLMGGKPINPLVVPFLGDVLRGDLGAPAIFAGMEPSAIPGERNSQILCLRVVEGEEMDLISLSAGTVSGDCFVAFG